MNQSKPEQLVFYKLNKRLFDVNRFLREIGLSGLADGSAVTQRVVLNEINIPDLEVNNESFKGDKRCLVCGEQENVAGFYVRSQPENPGKGFGPFCEEDAGFVVDLLTRKNQV